MRRKYKFRRDLIPFFSLLFKDFCSNKATQSSFIETEEYEKGFANHYEENIKTKINSFERYRALFLTAATIRLWITIIAIILFFAILAIAQVQSNYFGAMSAIEKKDASQLIFVSFFVASISLFYWAHKPIRDYKASIKDNIFPNILSFLGNYKYSSQCKNMISSLQNSQIIPRYDIEDSEDKISGTYKGVAIDLFETALSLSNKSRTIKFHGVLISLSVNKKFNSKTIVRKDSNAVVNWLKNPLSNNLESVKLEDPKFENMFDVYSSDQVEARYLLTTSFMERLLSLSESFEGNSIESSFYDNKLLIKIALKDDLFEPEPIYKPIDFAKDSKSLLKEMNMIFEIIDTLKLSDNIGM